MPLSRVETRHRHMNIFFNLAAAPAPRCGYKRKATNTQTRSTPAKALSMRMLLIRLRSNPHGACYLCKLGIPLLLLCLR